jgi:hypothetical protein
LAPEYPGFPLAPNAPCNTENIPINNREKGAIDSVFYHTFRPGAPSDPGKPRGPECPLKDQKKVCQSRMRNFYWFITETDVQQFAQMALYQPLKIVAEPH